MIEPQPMKGKIENIDVFVPFDPGAKTTCVKVKSIVSALEYAINLVNDPEEGYLCKDGHTRINKGNIRSILARSFPDVWKHVKKE